MDVVDEDLSDGVIDDEADDSRSDDDRPIERVTVIIIVLYRQVMPIKLKSIRRTFKSDIRETRNKNVFLKIGLALKK